MLHPMSDPAVLLSRRWQRRRRRHSGSGGGSGITGSSRVIGLDVRGRATAAGSGFIGEDAGGEALPVREEGLG